MWAKLKKQDKGFTIIEVLIVLAIAGLILLVVFLAVPALQRNSRNTQRKNDVSALLGGVNEYTSNNGGTLPTTAAQVLANAKVGFYTSGQGTNQGMVNVAAAPQGTLGANSANDRVVIVTGATCNGSAAVVGAARGVVALYEIETSGGFTDTCQAS